MLSETKKKIVFWITNYNNYYYCYTSQTLESLLHYLLYFIVIIVVGVINIIAYFAVHYLFVFLYMICLYLELWYHLIMAVLRSITVLSSIIFDKLEPLLLIYRGFFN